eukprot:CAMPEP_0182421092 /NCGR_PEP_ID=MMETSP1167-20130531/6310_1 /TAXON_ID=2988 /ORGANISM="Mallomonas Sp, Strain CCMP3275" /LENGTH=334 /DNA_ID=CAMNT_0024597869 /DNA_START=289 /DNA_END=1293 /DNA_ORIENTATION=-
MTGLKVKGVHRKGKQMWLEMYGGTVAILFHFGMTGSFLMKGQPIPQYRSFQISPVWPPKFTKLELVMENDDRLAFCDPRRLSRIKLRSDPLTTDPIASLGIDPYYEQVTSSYFQSQLFKYSAPIKAVLLDQDKIFSGIGNYIADEVCYQSNIHPMTPAKNIAERPEYVASLLNSIYSVITTATECNIASKDFPENWLFHYRWNKRAGKSQMPNGKPISYCTVGSRTTAVVLSEQILLKAIKEKTKSSNKIEIPAKTVSKDTTVEELSSPTRKRSQRRVSSMSPTNTSITLKTSLTEESIVVNRPKRSKRKLNVDLKGSENIQAITTPKKQRKSG